MCEYKQMEATEEVIITDLLEWQYDDNRGNYERFILGAAGGLLRMYSSLFVCTQWIPVDKMLPQENESVLILCKNGAMFTGFMAVYHDGPRWKIHTALNSTKLLNKGRVSHWMPLPASPRKDDGHA